VLVDFDVDPYYLLQAIALVSRDTPSCKRKDVLDLKPSAINDWWERVAGGMALGLEILQDDCHVTMPKWLPYQTMLAPLAAILAFTDQSTGADVGIVRSRLRKWIWCSIFTQSYEASPNTQAIKDVTELKSWLKGGPVPETIKSFNFDSQVLREVTPKQRALYRGTMCLVLGSGSGARDFHSGKLITRTLIETEHIDDHHIFPDNYLKTILGIARRSERDCILNRTLIDRTTNQVIQDRSPSDYLSEIGDEDGNELNSILESHLLPSNKDSSLFKNDFQKFLDYRLKMITEEIKHVTA